MAMSYTDYNSIFGTNYTAETLNSFTPHTVKLSQYRYYDSDYSNAIFSSEVTIVRLLDGDSILRMSEDVMKEMAKQSYYAYALYLDGTEGIGKLLDTSNKLNYVYQSTVLDGITTMTKAVNVFVPIFELIQIIMCVGVIMIFISFSVKTIKNKNYEIGILKALGTKNGSILRIFGLHVGLIALITCIISTVGYALLINLSNDILFKSMIELVPAGNIVLNLKFFTFMPKVMLFNCALIFVLAIISLIIPLIKIKLIKPVKIIKANE